MSIVFFYLKGALDVAHSSQPVSDTAAILITEVTFIFVVKQTLEIPHLHCLLLDTFMKHHNNRTEWVFHVEIRLLTLM